MKVKKFWLRMIDSNVINQGKILMGQDQNEENCS